MESLFNSNGANGAALTLQETDRVGFPPRAEARAGSLPRRTDHTTPTGDERPPAIAKAPHHGGGSRQQPDPGEQSAHGPHPHQADPQPNGAANGSATSESAANGSAPATTARPTRRDAADPPLPQRADNQCFGSLIGSSRQMQRIYDMIHKVAPTDATVFIAGESGTGKELVAEAIHQRSRRAARPFVALNCGAIPETLIDSELFGHEKGAFTGATRARGGVFEQAHGGTLFLDEITEMPIDLQARLLRVLETNRVHRVGSERDLPVDVRVIAASNRPASAALEQGRLREDLLYRLSVFPIHIPPLRERGEDAVVVANHFLAELNDQTAHQRRFSPDALDLVRRHPWPGNVRQVKHAVQRAFILAADVIDAHLLPDLPDDASAQRDGHLLLSVGTSIADAERQLIHATLEHFNGDKKKAADVLGMSLRTLYNRLNIYRAQRPRTDRRAANHHNRHRDPPPPHDSSRSYAFT